MKLAGHLPSVMAKTGWSFLSKPSR